MAITESWSCLRKGGLELAQRDLGRQKEWCNKKRKGTNLSVRNRNRKKGCQIALGRRSVNTARALPDNDRAVQMRTCKILQKGVDLVSTKKKSLANKTDNLCKHSGGRDQTAWNAPAHTWKEAALSLGHRFPVLVLCGRLHRSVNRCTAGPRVVAWRDEWDDSFRVIGFILLDRAGAVQVGRWGPQCRCGP